MDLPQEWRWPGVQLLNALVHLVENLNELVTELRDEVKKNSK